MKTLTLRKLRDWHVSYGTFVDELQAYDMRVTSLRKGSLLKRASSMENITFFFDKKTHELLMVEALNAIKSFGEVDQMAKEDILKKILVLANQDGQTRKTA